jgi:hypothetical protein
MHGDERRRPDMEQGDENACHSKAAIDEHEINVGGIQITPDRTRICWPTGLRCIIDGVAPRFRLTNVDVMHPEATGAQGSGRARLAANPGCPGLVRLDRVESVDIIFQEEESGATATEFDDMVPIATCVTEKIDLLRHHADVQLSHICRPLVQA